MTLDYVNFSVDFCTDKDLTEYYCFYNGTVFEIRNETFTCSDNCTGGQCTDTGCVNDTGCLSIGEFCDVDMPYTCSLGIDGCLDRTNGTLCDTDEICSGGICIPNGTAICENNITEGEEICDGTDLQEQTCQSYGYDEGNLSCCPDCQSFDFFGCRNVSSGCIDNDAEDYYVSSSAVFVSGFITGLNCSGDQGVGGGSIPLFDSCVGDILYEAVCNEENTTDTVTYDCSSEGLICQSGACVEDVCASFSCSDYLSSAECAEDACSVGECLWLGGEDGACYRACAGTVDSCGVEPSCQDCSGQDGCNLDEYRTYYCLSNSDGCDYTSDDCSDCSCSCGGYNQEETIENGNCEDGLDNDCDGLIDNDPECSIISFPEDYVSWWKFDVMIDGPSITIPDETGLNPGTFYFDATLVSDTERGMVLSLDDYSDYVRVDPFQGESTAAGTYTFWLYYTDPTDGEGFLTASGGDPYIYNNDGNMELRVYKESGDLDLIAVCPAIPINEWVFYAFTYDNTRGVIYQNGVFCDEDASVSPSYAPAPRLFIGSDRGLGDAASIGGRMDDVMMYNRALSGDEILQIYNAQVPAPSIEVMNSAPTLGPRSVLDTIIDWIKGLFT